ncbi:hypothetical protein CR513_31026, partial [Mucuna pruriens]
MEKKIYRDSIYKIIYKYVYAWLHPVCLFGRNGREKRELHCTAHVHVSSRKGGEGGWIYKWEGEEVPVWEKGHKGHCMVKEKKKKKMKKKREAEAACHPPPRHPLQRMVAKPCRFHSAWGGGGGGRERMREGPKWESFIGWSRQLMQALSFLGLGEAGERPFSTFSLFLFLLILTVLSLLCSLSVFLSFKYMIFLVVLTVLMLWSPVTH